MKLSDKIIQAIFFILWILVIPIPSFSQTHLEVTPGLSISETYDDNIYLDYTNETSDFITAISPSISFNILSQTSQLGLQYIPTFVWYDKEDQNDTIRHSGRITFEQDISEYLTFNLSNNYIKSEEPFEETEGIEGVRDSRQTYWRNTSEASLQYIFGSENTLSTGYRHTLSENEALTLDDSATQNPFAAVNYWFDTRNSIELNYEHIETTFTRDDDSLPSDNYQGYTASSTCGHRFTLHTTGSIGYGFTSRRFDGDTENYDVHEGSIGFEHAFSQDLSLAVEGGYFLQENEQSSNETGYTYNVSLINQFENGSLTLGGSGGWSDSYLDVDRRGFTHYWSANMHTEYQLWESFNVYAGGSYRHNRDSGNREWENWEGNGGLIWAFSHWSSLSLDYFYRETNDDVDTEDYVDNRVMLTISANRLFRW